MYHRHENHFRHTQWYSYVTCVICFGLLDIVLILAQVRCIVSAACTSMQDWCMVCADCIIGPKIVMGTPGVLLGDVGQVEAHFDRFGDSFNLSTRKVHGLRRTYHGHGIHFGHT
jgi:hypothetical protein